MIKLAELLAKSEDRLMSILHQYTIGTGYSKYSSTLEEAWRMSVATLSNLLIKTCTTQIATIELGPEIDYTQDPIAKFGIIEAQRHRERGIDIVMFLGLLKYYRQSYLDLVMEEDFEKLQYEKYRRFVDRFYDRIELGICGEWVKTDDAQQLRELQSNNRFMTNEKNKYLTIVESLPHIAILLDTDLQISYMNHAAVQFLKGKGVPGSEYYCTLRDRYLEYQENDADNENVCLSNASLNDLFPYLSSEVIGFYKSTGNQKVFQKQIEKGYEILHFEVKISRMLDISEKFLGLVVIMNDITELKKAESALKESEIRLRATLDATPFPVAIVDLQDDNVFYWSQSALNLFGHTATTAAEWYEIAYPDPDYRHEVIERWKPLLEQARESGQPVNTGEYQITCKDGSVRICELYATFLPNNLIVTLNDITERKRIEDQTSRLVSKIQKALSEVKTLSGLLPICSYCKKIRDDKGYWNQLEAYIQAHSKASFSHSICQECAKKNYPDMDLYDD